MNQENLNQNNNDNLASDSHNNLNVMTDSVVFDDTNSDLNIPSVLPNNNPHDSSSISLLTTQPDSIHQNQVNKKKQQPILSRLTRRIKKRAQ